MVKFEFSSDSKAQLGTLSWSHTENNLSSIFIQGRIVFQAFNIGKVSHRTGPSKKKLVLPRSLLKCDVFPSVWKDRTGSAWWKNDGVDPTEQGSPTSGI